MIDWTMTKAIQLPGECAAPVCRGWMALIFILTNVLLSVIPVGYQNETGFHHGVAFTSQTR